MTTTGSQDGFCKEHMASEGTFPDAASAAETAAAAALAPQLTASGKNAFWGGVFFTVFNSRAPTRSVWMWVEPFTKILVLQVLSGLRILILVLLSPEKQIMLTQLYFKIMKHYADVDMKIIF